MEGTESEGPNRPAPTFTNYNHDTDLHSKAKPQTFCQSSSISCLKIRILPYIQDPNHWCQVQCCFISVSFQLRRPYSSALYQRCTMSFLEKFQNVLLLQSVKKKIERSAVLTMCTMIVEGFVVLHDYSSNRIPKRLEQLWSYNLVPPQFLSWLISNQSIQ